MRMATFSSTRRFQNLSETADMFSKRLQWNDGWLLKWNSYELSIPFNPFLQHTPGPQEITFFLQWSRASCWIWSSCRCMSWGRELVKWRPSKSSVLLSSALLTLLDPVWACSGLIWSFTMR
jgi:hypothetical protein